MPARLNHLSLKKSFILLTSVSLIVATGLSVVYILFVSVTKERIMEPYMNSSTGDSIFGEEGNQYINIVAPQADIPDEVIMKSRLVEYSGTFVPLFIYIGSIIVAASVFYQVKLKQPLQLLMQGASRISDNDLNFQITYGQQDEMGELCGAFEKMRHELSRNNQQMWRMIEERKRLQAAFAHDLRTPLTVLKGYTEFLHNYIPTGKVSQEKILSTVSYMSDHVIRLEQYVETMNKVQQLEGIEVEVKAVPSDTFLAKLNSSMSILMDNSNIELKLTSSITATTLHMDETIVYRVVDNLVANALRYATSHISITCKVQRHKNHHLLVYEVADDGTGFSKDDLQHVTKPFYRNTAAPKGHQHYGIGLHICDILCQKHGGYMKLTNGENGGAKVLAVFAIKVDKK